MNELKTYKPSKEERYLRDLLALIHKDGGQHTAKRGLWNSTKDARDKIKKYVDLIGDAIEAIECGAEEQYKKELVVRLRKSLEVNIRRGAQGKAERSAAY